MDARVHYIQFTYEFKEEDRRECPACGWCAARLYTEGLQPIPTPTPSQVQRPEAQVQEPPTKKAKAAHHVLQELAQLQDLKGAGLLSSPEVKKIKDQLLGDL